jgi:hypothetical protein
LPGTTTLAYYKHSKIVEEESFITLGPGQPVGNHSPDPLQKLALRLDELPEVLVAVTNCGLSDS